MFLKQTPILTRITPAGRPGWRLLPAVTAILAATALAAPSAFAAQHMTRTTGQSEISVEEVQKEISAAFSAIAEYSVGQRDEALAKVRATMEMVDDEIDTLEQRARNNWSVMSEQARKKTSETLQVLRDRRNELSASLGALTQGTENTWDDLMSGLANAWSALKNAWNEAVEDSNANVGDSSEAMSEAESGDEATYGSDEGSAAQ